MQVTDMFKLAAKALLDRKMRSVLTILGITVGSAIILALIASSSGLNAGITANIQKTGANILTIRNAGGFFAAGSSNTYQLSQTDINYLQTLPGVVHAYPYFSYSASIANGGSTLEASVVGIDLSALPILYNGLTVAEGSIPLAGDTTSAAVGWSIANPVSGTPLGIHQMVSMSVTGVKGAKAAISYAVLANAILAQYGSALFSNIDDTVFISFQAATYLSKSPYFSGIYVVVDNTADVTNVQNTITTYYGSNVRSHKPWANSIEHSRDNWAADSILGQHRRRFPVRGNRGNSQHDVRVSNGADSRDRNTQSHRVQAEADHGNVPIRSRFNRSGWWRLRLDSGLCALIPYGRRACRQHTFIRTWWPWGRRRWSRNRSSVFDRTHSLRISLPSYTSYSSRPLPRLERFTDERSSRTEIRMTHETSSQPMRFDDL